MREDAEPTYSRLERTQDEQVDANLRQERLFAVLTSGFAVVAGVPACMGSYGLIAYSIAQRTNEIGIRMALGRGRGDRGTFPALT
ncbi:MAG TPA: hypothetical protein VL967_04110 [Terracidiphilus sp.]|nr:hypothetical protein [Terracidiphilus sp.]